MSRVKRGVTAHAKHKKVYKAAKGYYGRRKNTIRIAKQAVEKAGQYAFRDRKRRKRTFRALWIQRLNAAVRPFGLNYSRFIAGLAKSGLVVDRKVLSDLAIHEPAAFQAIVEKAKAALPAPALAAGMPGMAGHPIACGRLRDAGQARGAMTRRTMSDIAQLEKDLLAAVAPPRTKRRWRRCALQRSARAVRCRRCSRRSAR